MKELKYLNKFLWKYKILLLCGIFFIVISNIFALYPAEFVRTVFDKIILYMESDSKNKNINLIILKYTSLIILFAILKGLFMYFMRQTIIVMSRKIEFDLKNEIYKKYQALSSSFYKKNRTGDLMNRISEDVTNVRMYVGPALMYTINIIVLFYLLITKMLNINTTLTLYVLLPLPILAVTVYLVSNNINLRTQKVQKKLSKLTTIAQENYSGITIVKTFNNELNSFNKFFKTCQEYTQKQLQLVKIEAFFFPLIITLIGTSTIITIYVGGLESFKGNITTGNIAEFIIYINMLAWPVASIGWVTSLIQKAAASQKRINNFLFIEAEIKNNEPSKTKINGDIQFKNVSLVYKDNNIKALDKINFKINEGKILGVFGKTGSGKSTIANLLCRIYDVTSGEIIFGNNRLTELNLYNLRKSIGYIPQDGYLFSGTIKENIIFASDNYNEKKMISAAKKAEILNEILSFKKGFDSIIGERGIQLSGGQKQRIGIARTFYKDPDFFIFDDCLSAVDTKKEKKILQNLKEECKGKSAILISHNTNTLKISDNIIVLDKGKIIENDSHKKLMENKNLYYKIHKTQNTSII